MTRPTGSRSSASSSSRALVTPGRSSDRAVEPHGRHTCGRRAPQREHSRSRRSLRCTAASQRSQVVTVPQLRHASRRARPVRLSTQTTRPPEPSTSRATSTKVGENRPLRPTSSSRRSTTTRGAHPWRAVRVPSDVARSAAERATTDGHGETSRQGTPARRARSIATSRAFQVGDDSFCRPGSSSSNTTTALSAGSGAKTAERPPTTVDPPAAAAKSWGQRATAAPPLRSERAKRSAATTEGCTTNAWPPRAAAAAIGAGSAPGGTVTTTGPGPFASTARTSASTPASPWGRGRTGGRRPSIRSGDAARISVGNRPAHRRAAHRQMSIVSASGPAPDTLAIGCSTTPGGGVELGSITQPATRRPCSGTRTMVPTSIRDASASGTR